MIVAINAISAKSGGILTYTRNLINSFANYKEHIFHFWVSYNGDFRGNGNVILHKVKASDYNFIRRFFYEQFILKKEIHHIKANVLFSSANFGIFGKSLNQVLLIRRLISFNRMYYEIIWPHLSKIQQIENKIRRILIRISAKYSNIIVFPSNSMKEDFLRFYPKFLPKCYVNYYGTLESKFNNVYKKKNINETIIKLLYVSVYYAHKNPGIMAKAIKIIKDRGYKVLARISMDMESDHAKRYVTWKDDYEALFNVEIKDNIILGSENYEKIQSLYQNADIFIFPSFMESFGHPIIEAMSAGLPIIAADTPINHEICAEAALYFSPFDSNELAEKILLLNGNQDLKNKLSAIGKSRAKIYKWENHVKKLIQIFEKLG